jgi:hypothetical protein
MAHVLTQIEQDIMECIGTHGPVRCSIFDPDSQRSVRRRLEKGWDPIVWTIHNGSELMSAHHDPIPFHSQVVCCPEHEDKLIARGGWDGTGERQSK